MSGRPQQFAIRSLSRSFVCHSDTLQITIFGVVSVLDVVIEKGDYVTFLTRVKGAFQPRMIGTQTYQSGGDLHSPQAVLCPSLTLVRDSSCKLGRTICHRARGMRLVLWCGQCTRWQTGRRGRYTNAGHREKTYGLAEVSSTSAPTTWPSSVRRVRLQHAGDLFSLCTYSLSEISPRFQLAWIVSNSSLLLCCCALFLHDI